jgi:hypothetical protein
MRSPATSVGPSMDEKAYSTPVTTIPEDDDVSEFDVWLSSIVALLPDI